MRLSASVFAVLAFLAFVLAGCATPDTSLSARAEERQVPESPNYPGLTVRGRLSADGDVLLVSATARNDGDRTYQVEQGCGIPWSQELYRGPDRVAMAEPQVRCLAFALADFAPGQVLAYNASWDGTVWDEDRERQVEAAPGEYVWSVRFVAYQKGGDISAKRFDLDFNVTAE